MKCKHNRPRRRQFGGAVSLLSFSLSRSLSLCLSSISFSLILFHTHTHFFPLLLSLFLFQSDYRPRNLIKLRLPSGALAKNQWAFTRQIKRTTASGYFYTANSNTQHTLHYILIMFGFDWFAWVYVCIMYIYI